MKTSSQLPCVNNLIRTALLSGNFEEPTYSVLMIHARKIIKWINKNQNKQTFYREVNLNLKLKIDYTEGCY
jgi:hypothetical protein